MSDIAGSSATGTALRVGGVVASDIAINGDKDWLRVSLVAGQEYVVEIKGAGSDPLLDPVLTLFDQMSVRFGSVDSTSDGPEKAVFTAGYTGVYYIEVKAGEAGQSGNYEISLRRPEPLPLIDPTEVSDYLTDGYWNDSGRERHAFSGPSISYDVSGLTALGQSLATQALAHWSAITGLTFTVADSGGAQLTFDDNEPGAFATYDAAGGTTLGASVNVGRDWLTEYGRAINGYSFQTYVHEIGHALGLGHAGPYNGDATWSWTTTGDNHYLNDSWQMSVMSYFDQDTNTAVSATFAYVVGPMMADILAVRALYGDIPVNVGATRWGFNTNVGDAFDFGNYAFGRMVAFTINDSDGIDILDASGFSGNQTISLIAGSYSSIGGEVGNIAIVYGSVIENAIGGRGSDAIYGNAADNVIDGGHGWDTMHGGIGNDVYYVDTIYDTIVEYTNGDLDRVYSSASYVQPMNVEEMVLIGSRPIRASGNSQANTIFGNDAANRLLGMDGDDVLHGEGGNDLLEGGLGADSMFGGSGNDRFVVDNISDAITEYATEGLDSVTASVSYVLGANIENMTLSGSRNVNATGNELANVLRGNSGNNIIGGGAGNDRLFGGAGRDSFQFDTAPAVINRDTILDFTSGEDRIQLDNAVMAELGLTT
ncbi:peptidase, partial [Salmonella enterica subsp. enterica serovar Kottbus]|nr:peptidase [Salmonella enterica subsp. enterica serovar Kottbus]